MDRIVVIRSFAFGFSFSSRGALRFGQNRGMLGSSGFRIIIVKKDGCQGSAHMPFHIVGQHAQKNMRSHPASEAVMNGADLKIDALVASKGLLNMREIFVGGNHILGTECLRRNIGAHHVDPVKRCLLDDAFLIAPVGKTILFYVEMKVLADLVAIDRLPDPHSDISSGQETSQSQRL